MDPDEFAVAFIEWVYSNPGMPPEEYASELARRLRSVDETTKHRHIGADMASGST